MLMQNLNFFIIYNLNLKLTEYVSDFRVNLRLKLVFRFFNAVLASVYLVELNLFVWPYNY